jgi:chloramphenicol 3-O-phosphotransferase
MGVFYKWKKHRMIVAGRVEMSAQPSGEAIRQLLLRYRLSVETAKTYYDNGFSVVLQDNYYGETLPYVVDLLKGYPVQTTVLCPNVQTVKQREKTRGKVGYNGFTVEALYADFMKETPRIGFWLDNSEQSPEQSVETIFSHFGG